MIYGYFGDDGTDEAVPARDTLTPEDEEPEWQAAAKEKSA
jgi:hypothetical protein